MTIRFLKMLQQFQDIEGKSAYVGTFKEKLQISGISGRVGEAEVMFRGPILSQTYDKILVKITL